MHSNTMVIFAALDERSYMSKTNEGALVPIRPPKKDITHVPRVQTLVPPELAAEIVVDLSSLLKAAQGLEAVLHTPMLRHMEGPCCHANGHLSGYPMDGHRNRILQLLDGYPKTIRQATERNQINITVTNLSKTILQSSGGWPSSTVAH